MVRWYAAYQCAGNSTTKAALVTRGVNQLGIKDEVPLMRIELARKGQWYLFLAIECDGEGAFPVPDSLSNLENFADLRGRLGIPLDERESINKMSVTPVETQEFFDRIPRMVSPTMNFQPMDELEADEFFSPPVLVPPSGEGGAGQSVLDKDQVLAQDRLLIWCSTKGSGSWSQFLDACTTLGSAEGRQSAKRLQRRLRLLGHIETTSHGHWSVAPPALVQSGQTQVSNAFFLCGQRTGQMISDGTDFGQLRLDPQPRGDAPSRISTGSGVSLDSVIGRPVGPIRNVGVASALLADNLKSLKEWESDLDQFPYVFNDVDYVNGGYTVKKYSLSEFHEGFFREEAGLYELSPNNNAGGTEDGTVTGYYNEEDRTWHRGDWYGLRFLAKVRTNESYSYDYDAGTGDFSIPQDWRWPEVYERALVLSSGHLPVLTGSRINYEQINETTLSGLHQKLEVAD